jgi:epoxyqueuosine reductase
MSLAASIKAEAAALGFAQAGILPAGPSLTHSFYEAWLARGFAGEMAYLERHAPVKQDLARLAPGARSAIFLALDYHHPSPPEPKGRLWGRVSSYAWGRDYHEVIGEKLRELAAFIEREAGRPVKSWAFVDTAPVMEREFAARAALGWVGKHGVVIHWRRGSWLFLAELLVDIPLEYDHPIPPRRREGRPRREKQPIVPSGPAAGLPPLELRESCGSCTACIEACPTGAIVGEKTVDSRRCISYHTIELKGAIPSAFRRDLGEWVFGCDICQEVCPWNRRARRVAEEAFAPSAESARPSLPALLALDEEGFRERFRGTALRRTKRRGLLRNAAIVLGNRLAGRAGGSPAPAGKERGKAIAALQGALGDPEPLVRGAAAWALGEAGGAGARQALESAEERERDADVREELRRGLVACRAGAGQKKAAAPGEGRGGLA